ncbi:unnamed protein product [Trichogramma brassicae]|uniref:Uncharacterized protein n=1 Tax=Trichogramma brassicae TaxID=86971 RepID=A0A6H5IV40_9HYME|nr:unnamed protein product [Trichogramma brassicae]
MNHSYEKNCEFAELRERILPKQQLQIESLDGPSLRLQWTGDSRPGLRPLARPRDRRDPRGPREARQHNAADQARARPGEVRSIPQSQRLEWLRGERQAAATGLSAELEKRASPRRAAETGPHQGHLRGHGQRLVFPNTEDAQRHGAIELRQQHESRLSGLVPGFRSPAAERDQQRVEGQETSAAQEQRRVVRREEASSLKSC